MLDCTGNIRRIFAMQKRGFSLREIGTAVHKSHTSVVEILHNRDAYRGGLRGESMIRWPAILR